MARKTAPSKEPAPPVQPTGSEGEIRNPAAPLKPVQHYEQTSTASSPATEPMPAQERGTSFTLCHMVGCVHWEAKTSPGGQWKYQQCRTCGRIVGQTPVA